MITHGEIHPGFFVNDTFGMGEDVKAFFAVVSAHAALSDTAKSHFTCGKMDDGIVDTSSSVRDALGYFMNALPVLGKEVECP